MGDLSELNEKDYDDLNQHKNTKTFSMRESQAPPPVDCLDIELDDLEVISTLGVGGFGRVELVKVKVRSKNFSQNSLSAPPQRGRPVLCVRPEVSEEAARGGDPAAGARLQ